MANKYQFFKNKKFIVTIIKNFFTQKLIIFNIQNYYKIFFQTYFLKLNTKYTNLHLLYFSLKNIPILEILLILILSIISSYFFKF